MKKHEGKHAGLSLFCRAMPLSLLAYAALTAWRETYTLFIWATIIGFIVSFIIDVIDQMDDRE